MLVGWLAFPVLLFKMTDEPQQWWYQEEEEIAASSL